MALKLHHLAIKLNLPILEFFLIENLIDQFAGAVESFLRVLDFVNIDVSHFLLVLGEILGQACHVAKFWDQVDSVSLPHRIFHVDKEQWLVRKRDI